MQRSGINVRNEARKYHLNLIVANQFTTQLTDEIRDAVFGNVGTIVSFRIGQNDVDALSRYFQPQFEGEDLLRVPSYNTIVRTLVNGVPTQPFSMATLPPLGNPNSELADALKQLSAAKYGKPRASVEKVIFERLATKIPEPKPFQPPFTGSAAPVNRPSPNASSMAVPAGVGSGSFLDEWLAKQRASAPVPALSSARSSLPPHGIRQQVAGPQEPLVPQQPGSPAIPKDEVEASTGNISSSQLDQQEISGIAQELKKSLKTPETTRTQRPDILPQEGPLAVRPEPQLSLEKSEAMQLSQEGVFHISRQQGHGPAPDDTIFIDNDGKLHPNQPTADENKPLSR